jgi:hypothetical protein
MPDLPLCSHSDVLGPAPLSTVRSTMRKRLIVSLVVVALAAAGMLLFLSRSDAPLQVTLSFQGFTNNTAGHPLAVFVLSNRSDHVISRAAIYEVRGRSGSHAAEYTPASLLPPGQSENISISAPTNQEPWRMYLLCSRDGWRRKFSDWLGVGSRQPLRALVPERLQGVPRQYVRSAWIEP